MRSRVRPGSPILAAAMARIGEASETTIAANSAFSHSFEMEVDAASSDPEQPRASFSDEALERLADTLRTEGQLQPILVRRDPARKDRWIIVAGERRWRAAKLLGWPRMLAIPFSGNAEVAMLIENLQRVDLSPVEEAQGLRRLIDGKGWTQEAAAKILGKAKSDVSGTLRILRLPSDVLTAVLTSEHPPGKNVLVELARMEDAVKIASLAALAVQGRLTVRAIRDARHTSSSPPARKHATSKTRDVSSSINRASKLINDVTSRVTRVGVVDANALKALRAMIDELLVRSS